MTDNTNPNARSTSTTYAWRKVKIRATPERPSRAAAKPSSPALKPWPLRRGLSITVEHRGGAESWWQITARGRVWRRPGHLLLDDVLQEVFRGTGGKPL